MSNSSISANAFLLSSELRRASRAAVWSALWRAVVSGASSLAAALAKHYRARRAIAELSALNDRMLRDIGVERHDIPRIVRCGRASDELPR